MFRNLKKNINPFFSLEEFSTAEKILKIVSNDLLNAHEFMKLLHPDHLAKKMLPHPDHFANKMLRSGKIDYFKLIIPDDELSKLTVHLAKIIQNTWGNNYGLYQKTDDQHKKNIQTKIAKAFNGYITDKLNNFIQLRGIKKDKFFGSPRRDIFVAEMAFEITKATNFSEDNLAAALKPLLRELLVELIEKDPSYLNGLQRLIKNRSTYFSLLPEDLMKTTLHLFSPQNVAKPDSLEDTPKTDNTP